MKYPGWCGNGAFRLGHGLQSMRQTAIRPALGAVLGILLCAAARGGPLKSYPDISALFYDFEVAGYCGLVTNRVGLGFQQRAAQLVARYSLDRETVDELRGDAWQAAHAEWQNRGLGGFRNWCRTEGRAAAERFEEMAVSGP